MPKTLAPCAPYAHRRSDVTVVQIEMDREAEALLRHYPGPGKRLGRFVARLVYEHDARMEERTRLTQAGQPVLAGATAGEDCEP